MRPRCNARLSVLLVACALLSTAGASSWGGASSYFLHAMQPADQAQVLDAMQAAGMKVVRIILNSVYANNKGSGSNAVPDLEDVQVGQYDDTALYRVDALMVQVASRNMKLIIALHDRYSLGCWATDAYVGKYNIPTTSSCSSNPEANDIVPFYRNTAAAADMDRRFAHIVSHTNSLMGGRPWSQITDAILGFDIENEAQAHSANGVISNRQWICSRATNLKPLLGSGMLILTGGGADIWDSAIPEHFACPSIDVVTLHTYSGTSAINGLGSVIQDARNSGKRLILEEFGATGGGKAASLSSQISASNQLGLPWMVWEVVKPNNYNDYETFTDDTASWAALTAARSTLAIQGAFAWPEISGGTTSAPTPMPTANPTPAPTFTPAPTGGVCDKCSTALCLGGCKCDSQCGCKAGLGGSKCDKCNLAQADGGCKCDSNCDCLAGTCGSSAPTPTPTPTPTPKPTPASICDKCNTPLCLGGCKCNSQCGCLAGGGANICDKCNLAQSSGGCKCDYNCNCLAGTCLVQG